MMYKFRLLNKFLHVARYIIKLKKIKNVHSDGVVKLQRNVKIVVEPKGKIVFGRNCLIKHDSIIYVKQGAELIIGNNFSTGHHTEISVGSSVCIGDDVIMAPYTYITDANHGYSDIKIPIRMQNMNHSPVLIGSNIWMGRSSMILPGAQVKSNTIIAAAAIVTNKMESGDVVLAGIPARIIKEI